MSANIVPTVSTADLQEEFSKNPRIVKFMAQLSNLLSSNGGSITTITATVAKLIADLLSFPSIYGVGEFTFRSNSFGSCLDFADGNKTRIQWGSLAQSSHTFGANNALFVAGPDTITFPYPFADTSYGMPLPTPTEPVSSSGLWTGNSADGNKTTTSNKFFVWRSAASTSLVGLNWIAIGARP